MDREVADRWDAENVPTTPCGRPPPTSPVEDRRVAEAKERRKVLEQRVKDELGARSFRRQGSKNRYGTQDWTEEPLQTVLFVGIDTDRYGTVRLGAAATIIVPAVEELFEAAPPTALSPVMEITTAASRWGWPTSRSRSCWTPTG